ncbi:Voltage-gated potassium channel subunit beta-2 [Phytophthora boehmeriae]|uniref:Voltage-gated potassium channel subunit beta-2 n=1 Tax=Phytophthora boehmeriae TaxID=109152 RepID=A0A8T1WEZ6_9STRA|nr:Voltage-gated potassium channel subunit beta-2 [Phytophthora boehmeriae]
MEHSKVEFAGDVNDGIRFADPFFNNLFGDMFGFVWSKSDELKMTSNELGCSLTHLSMAWCISNESVFMVLVGASRPSHL